MRPARNVRHVGVAVALFGAFAWLYARTAAPSVMSGDSAEFQMAASLLGVPHPTTYPLYMLLGALATLFPIGDLAHRVTLVSAVAAAAAVALVFSVARRVSGSLLVGTLVALAFGVAPGLWNAATMAEVYALLALLLALLALLLLERRWFWAAFVAGLGCTHHGLFVLAGAPLLAGATVGYLVSQWRANTERRHLAPWFATVCGCFALGLLPWLFPLVQYARYGPFNGVDYGLPRHYFWGAPQSWAETWSLLAGGPIRNGIFERPTVANTLITLHMVASRMRFEWNIAGCALGVLGFVALARIDWRVWLGAIWVFGITLVYLVLLGPAVQDAPVFTLPMLLPWALWIGVGAHAGLRFVARLPELLLRAESQRARQIVVRVGLLLLVGATLFWGQTRVPYTNKRHLSLFRTFGEATLELLPPRAVVLTHWEQGMTLQYLVLAERQRPDVWIDVVEPNDEAWLLRAQRRYADRPVFFVGSAADVSALPATLLLDDAYADVFRLNK